MKVKDSKGEVVQESPPSPSPDQFHTAVQEILDSESGAFSPSATGTVPLPAEELVTLEIAICRRYCETGNMALCAREFGKTVYEINKMARQLWWQEEETRFKRDSATVLDSTYTRILDRSLLELEDRIIKGEVTGVNKDGSKRRMPITASVLTRVADSVFLKRQLLRNEPTSIPGDTDRMNLLANKLRALGAKDPSIIDGAVTEVPRDEQ
jgi:hypothetical protein